MSHAARIGALLMLCVVGTSAAQLPAAEPSQSSCATPSPSYLQCALLFDGGRVHRGAASEVILRPGFMSPMALSRVVAGDSALHYARRYERDWKRGNGFLLSSVALMGGAFVLAHHSSCNPYRRCDNYSDAQVGAMLGMAVGGLATEIVGVRALNRASVEAARAVW